MVWKALPYKLSDLSSQRKDLFYPHFSDEQQNSRIQSSLVTLKLWYVAYDPTNSTFPIGLKRAYWFTLYIRNGRISADSSFVSYYPLFLFLGKATVVQSLVFLFQHLYVSCYFLTLPFHIWNVCEYVYVYKHVYEYFLSTSYQSH